MPSCFLISSPITIDSPQRWAPRRHLYWDLSDTPHAITFIYKTHLNRKLGFMVCSSTLLCQIFSSGWDSQNTVYSEMDWKTNDKSYQKKTVSCDLCPYSACAQQKEVTTRSAPAARPCSVSPCRHCRYTDPGFAPRHPWGRELEKIEIAQRTIKGQGRIRHCIQTISTTWRQFFGGCY